VAFHIVVVLPGACVAAIVLVVAAVVVAGHHLCLSIQRLGFQAGHDKTLE